MTSVKAIYTGFVGSARGHVELSEGDEYDIDHPLVQAHPGLFAGFPAVPGPARAVETVGEIEEVEPGAAGAAADDPTATAAEVIAPKRRGRPKSNG